MGVIKFPFDIADLNPDWWFDFSRTDRMIIDVSNRMQQYNMITGGGQLNQGTGNFRSTLSTGPSDRNVQLFNGTNNKHNFNFGDLLVGGFEITCVFKTPAAAKRSIYAISNGGLPGFPILEVLANGLLSTFLGGANIDSMVPVDDGNYHVGSLRYNGASSLLRVYVDGNLEASASRGNDATAENWVLGVNRGKNGDFYVGEMAEGLKITGEAPDTTFNAYQQHLCGKWGIEYKGP